MKNYKLSIMNSAIAGILICAMLAACGTVEKQQKDNALEPLGGSAQNSSDASDILNTSHEDAEPQIDTTSPDEADPDADATSPDEDEPGTDATLPDETEPDADVTSPDETKPDTDVTVPAETDQEPNTEAPETDEPEASEAPEVLDSKLANIIIETASAQLGVPYTYGGTSPDKGFDSTGFTYYCVRSAGISFPRQLSDQLGAGSRIDYNDLTPGDIVYFSPEPGENASFCGVYYGGGLMIYSPVPGDVVKTANITTNYWTSRFVTGIRPTK